MPLPQLPMEIIADILIMAQSNPPGYASMERFKAKVVIRNSTYDDFSTPILNDYVLFCAEGVYNMPTQLPPSYTRAFFECIVNDEWIASLKSLDAFERSSNELEPADWNQIFKDSSGSLYIPGHVDEDYDPDEVNPICIGKLETKVREWRWPIHNIAKCFTQLGKRKWYNCTIFDCIAFDFCDDSVLKLRTLRM